LKSRSNITSSDFVGLKSLKEASGGDFKQGIVLYTGKNILSFGNDMIAMPITAFVAQ
jgi:uncharacterized protein